MVTKGYIIMVTMVTRVNYDSYSLVSVYEALDNISDWTDEKVVTVQKACEKTYPVTYCLDNSGHMYNVSHISCIYSVVVGVVHSQVNVVLLFVHSTTYSTQKTTHQLRWRRKTENTVLGL